MLAEIANKRAGIPGAIEFDDLYKDFDAVRWSVACREMCVRIIHKRYDAAMRILREFCRDTEPKFATLDSSVQHVFPIRIGNALEDHGYMTIRAASNATDEELLRIENFGMKSIDLVREVAHAIRNGKVPEINYEEAEEIIDFDCIPSIDQVEKSKHKRTEKLKDMSDIDQIRQAIKTLATNSDATVQVIDKEIMRLEDDIATLKRMRKIAGLASGRDVSDKTNRGPATRNVKPEIEDKIFACITENGPLTPMEVSKITGLAPITIGITVANSSRMTKSGNQVVLA